MNTMQSITKALVVDGWELFAAGYEAKVYKKGAVVRKVFINDQRPSSTEICRRYLCHKVVNLIRPSSCTKIYSYHIGPPNWLDCQYIIPNKELELAQYDYVTKGIDDFQRHRDVVGTSGEVKSLLCFFQSIGVIMDAHASDIALTKNGPFFFEVERIDSKQLRSSLVSLALSLETTQKIEHALDKMATLGDGNG